VKGRGHDDAGAGGPEPDGSANPDRLGSIPLLELEDDDAGPLLIEPPGSSPGPAAVVPDLVPAEMLPAADPLPVPTASDLDAMEIELESLEVQDPVPPVSTETGLEPVPARKPSPIAEPYVDPAPAEDPGRRRRDIEPWFDDEDERPTSWCTQCGAKHAQGDCRGEITATEPERHGWRAVVQTQNGRKVYGVLLVPSGDLWRARVLTFPRTLWVVPGGTRTLKFLGRDPEQAETRAVRFIKGHVAKCKHEFIDDPELKANPEPIELDACENPDEVDSVSRKPRAVTVLYGPEKPNRKGKTGDLSAKGMFISTSEPYATGTVLRILLELAGARIPLRGVVKWTRANSIAGRPGGMGVELIRPPSFYSQYIRHLP
jgi:hypothetical protein